MSRELRGHAHVVEQTQLQVDIAVHHPVSTMLKQRVLLLLILLAQAVSICQATLGSGITLHNNAGMTLRVVHGTGDKRDWRKFYLKANGDSKRASGRNDGWSVRGISSVCIQCHSPNI